jgi:hypothetical protein
VDWYYQVELEPGKFTTGQPRPTLALARVLWAAVSFADRSCLDIGTQDGAMPVLMARRGGVVTATDIVSREHRVQKVRECFEIDFRYVAGINLSEMADALDAETFDMVNFAGVLYHTLNPLGSLALARARCRVGGLMLVETATLQKRAHIVAYNAEEALGVGPGTYFMPSTATLEYWLRMVGLRPLAAAYTGSRQRRSRPRVAVLCRSEAAPCPRISPDDCMTSPRHLAIMRREGGIDWECPETASETVPVGEFETGVFPLGQNGLFEMISRNRAYRPTPRRSRLERDARM